MSPKQQERRFDPKYADTLLEIAEGDFRTAEFAGVRRYEEGAIIYEPEDLTDAHRLTERVISWAASIIRS